MQLFSYKPSPSSSGFTLVEFIVIMSIFAIMIAVVMFNFTGFRSAVTLDNLAHDIALSIRQIQNNAGASRSATGDPENEIPRGIQFTKDATGYAKEFILFEDNNRTGMFESDSDDTVIDRVNIQTPDSITSIGYASNPDETITPLDADPDIAITFKRYLTEAMFTAGDDNAEVQGAYKLQITISSPEVEDNGQPRQKNIIITKLGQISIE